MTQSVQLLGLLCGILFAVPLSAQENKAFGWWEIVAAQDHPNIIFADNCYVFISAETIAFFRPSAQVVGDFATVNFEAAAWSHDVKAFAQKNREVFAILDHDMRAKLQLDTSCEDRMIVDLTARNTGGTLTRRPAARLHLIRTSKEVASTDVLQIAHGLTDRLGKAARKAVNDLPENAGEP